MSARKSLRKSKSHTKNLVSTTPVARYEAAFVQTKKARDALDPAELWAINRDVPTVITTVLAATGLLEPLRPTIRKMLPAFDSKIMDLLPTYADALAWANGEYLRGVESTRVLPELVEEGVVLRDRLAAGIAALAKCNVLGGAVLSELKGTRSYSSVGIDLHMLAQTYRVSWSTVQGKTGITPEELQRAEELYVLINDGIADKTKPSQGSVTATDDRARAYSLVVDAYNQVHRAVAYVRGEEDDVEKYLPALRAGRRGRRREPDAAANGARTPANGASGTPAMPNAPALPTSPVTPAPAANDNGPDSRAA